MRISINDEKIDTIIRNLGPVLRRAGLRVPQSLETISAETRQELARFIVDDILSDYIFLLKQQGAGAAFSQEQLDQLQQMFVDRTEGVINNKRGLGKYVESTPMDDIDDEDIM